MSGSVNVNADTRHDEEERKVRKICKEKEEKGRGIPFGEIIASFIMNYGSTIKKSLDSL